ncbi:DUF2314 domain-containing protein, partial [Tenacibaculum sp.]|nr:DUF2314 domain-containing protein [Tenacibaculum sp.]
RHRDKNPDVYDMPSEDKRMNWGIEKAQLTFHYFKECLTNPKSGQQYFSVKARIEDNQYIEHIWLTEPSFDKEGNIYGTVGNEPIDVKNVKINEKIGIPFNYVSDWMIIEEGRLIGGYTIRAIREGLSGNELKDFDKNLSGIFIDEGEDYFIPNYETPEGAILLLENAYDNDDIDMAIDCKDFYKEAELMLKSKIQIEIDDELINKTAEILKLSFIQSLKEDGIPKFYNTKRAFKRQYISDEHCIVIETCFHSNGEKSVQKLSTYKINNEWKVLGLIDSE